MNAPNPWALYSEPPRAWQVDAYPLAMRSLRERRDSVFAVCTGAGKSRLIEAVAWTITRTIKPGHRVVIAVPTRALVEQTAAGLTKILGRQSVGMWYTGARRDGLVQVVCLDSLSTLNDYMIAQGLKTAALVVDEVHRSAPESYREQLERLRPATRIGITATPFRSVEGEALTGWKEIGYRYSIDQAIADSVLVPWRSFLPVRDIADATEATIAMIHDHAPPGPGVVSAVSIEDAEQCAVDLTAAGIPALALHSKLGSADKRRVIEALRTGEIRAIVHVAMLVEGVDLPWLRWLAMRRPRNAAVGIVQELGRILRTMSAPDQWGAKEHAVLLLPHVTPVLNALSRPPALGEPEKSQAQRLAEMAEDEAEDERVEQDSLLPEVSAVADVTGYIAALVAAARAAGVGLDDSVPAGRWRDLSPTLRQVEALRRLDEDKRKSGLRYLPAEHSGALRTCLRRPEMLTTGAVSDLITLVAGLRQHGGRVYGQTNDFWPGLRVGLPEVPVGACDAVGGRKRRKVNTP